MPPWFYPHPNNPKLTHCKQVRKCELLKLILSVSNSLLPKEHVRPTEEGGGGKEAVALPSLVEPIDKCYFAKKH